MSIKEREGKCHGKSLPFTTTEDDTTVWQTLKCDKDVKKPHPPAVHFYGSVHYGKIYMQYFILQGDHTWRPECFIQ